MSKRLPRYTDKDRYPYHWLCTRIEPASESFKKMSIDSPSAPKWAKERTHGCYCSAWRQKEDGTFLHWRDGKWMEPIRGSIKSKPIE